MLENEIMEITEDVAHQILESGRGTVNIDLMGCFWTKEDDKYVGLDNSNGCCWVEEFRTKRACIKWLRGD